MRAHEIADAAINGRKLIPVRSIDQSGKPTADFVVGSPCIEITVSYSSHSGLKAVHLNALLDTGADFVYLDPAIVTVLETPALRSLSANGRDATVHKAVISLPSIRWRQSFEVCAMPLRAQGHGHDAILGRSFLRHGRFVFDVGKGEAPSFAIDVGDTECP